MGGHAFKQLLRRLSRFPLNLLKYLIQGEGHGTYPGSNFFEIFILTKTSNTPKSYLLFNHSIQSQASFETKFFLCINYLLY